MFKKKGRLPAVILAVLLFCCTAMPVFAQSPGAHKRTVRVGYYSTPGFQEYDEATDTYSGYGYEYLLALAQYANWSYEFVPVSFADGVTMLENGQLDLMNNVSQTEDRLPYLSYSSSSSGSNCGYLAADAEDTSIAYADFEGFNDLTVALVTTSIYSQKFLDYCAENDFMPTIRYYDTKEDAIAALADGEVDARIITSSQNIDVHIIAKFAPEDFYFAVPNTEPDLLRELNQAMSSLKTNDPDFENRLEKKYYSNVADDNTVLTAAEQTFIQENPVVTVAYDADCYPLSYTDADGQFAGAIAGLYDMISQHTGLQFEFMASEAAGLENLTQNQAAQLYAELPYDYVWANSYGVNLTPPFADISIVEARRNTSTTGGIMAVVDGYYLAEQCQENYGEQYTYKIYPNTKACLDAVRAGEADLTCMTSYEGEYYQSLAHYRSIAFTISQKLNYPLSIGVSQLEDPCLFSIMLKGLNAISADETDALFREITLDVQRPDALTMLLNHPEITLPALALFAFLLAGIMFFLLHYRSIQRKNLEISQKNVQLADAVSLAEQANAAKSQFLSRMSHEIRTPMNAIVGLTTIAKQHENEPEKVDDYLTKIDTSSKVLLNLINDVLDMSAIESNKLKIGCAQFDMKQVLSSISTIYYSQCQAKSIRFSMAVDLPDELLLGDSLRVNQILLNLISNAYKFTEAGGSIHVTVKELSRKEQTAFLRFTVSDTGCGMTPEMLNRLFQPFEQESAATAQKHGGSGLGLSIAKNLVEMMHGAIKVESQKDKGTTFTVDLPFATCGENSCRNSAELNNLRILVADDDATAREYAGIVLKRIGLEYETACGGQQTLDMIRRAADEGHPYAMCLIDWKMADLDGVEVTRRIRASEAEKSIIIIVSAYDLTEVETQAKAAGADYFIAKPLFQSTLFDVLISLTGGQLKTESAQPEDYDFTGHRVLLAEDNQMNTEIAIELLHMVNMECDHAANGQLAVELFQNSTPGTYDLILMDVQMPVMDGYTAARTLRALPRPDAKTIPIYAMTANAFTEDVSAALSAGMNGHIAKPIDTDILYRTLNTAIQNKP